MKRKLLPEAVFRLKSEFAPTGDQPAAIEKLTQGIQNGKKMQTLLGVTGSGKTFTMANIIKNCGRPALILEPNKTLAAQVCTEFREFFPENAVEFFVSYYDYYQPEAYVPGRDMYIEKDALINDEIDQLRHSATTALFERRDVVIVASVSCIYSLGSPEEYSGLLVSLREGQEVGRDEVIEELVRVGYARNDMNLTRGKFRAKGDTLEVIPAAFSGDKALRIEFFGDEIERISEVNLLTGDTLCRLRYAAIFPASHYTVSDPKREAALEEIAREMEERAAFFRSEHKLLEAQRIEERTRYDLEMLRETGFCSGVENYSRVLAGRAPGSTPSTLLDYFPEDFLLFIDESHITVPQVRGMGGGDFSRKQNLVEYGFRLPSAYDNRPLHFEEFLSKLNQTVFVSATPGPFEEEMSEGVAEQLIRPTGLLDPEITVRPVEGQIDDLLEEIRLVREAGEKVLITTLTTKMAEDLTDYLASVGIPVKYLHHKVDTMERSEILRDLRLGKFDVLVGINLLREGLDLPEVSLVAVLDADKEGFLRSARSLIQTAGRAARNEHGRVIFYGDSVTDSMKIAIEETARRRSAQAAYNREHGIVPKTIQKAVRDAITLTKPDEESRLPERKLSKKDKEALLVRLKNEMKDAAKILDFERAALLRDRIRDLEAEVKKKQPSDKK